MRICAKGCTHPSGKPVLLRCESLARLVPPGANHGYDVEVQVGLARFLGNRQRKENLQELLDKYRISPSSGQVSVLARRFLDHLEALHWKRAPQLRAAMRADGGYPMNIDATGEDGQGTTLVVYNSWRGWVLGAWKLSTERADLVLPHLRRVVRAFGPPRTIMRDLGKAMILAARQLVRELKRAIPILGCHTHLLRDVGKDLMKQSYDQLRGLIRRHGLRPRLRTLARNLGRRLSAKLPGLREDVGTWADSATEHDLPPGPAGEAAVRALAQWVLDYPRDGDGLGFPFDSPYRDLYRRCRTVRRAADAFLRKPSTDARTRRALKRLACAFDPVLRDKASAKVAATLTHQAALFGRLRQALRLDPDKKAKRKKVLSPRQAAAELQDIRKAVERLKRDLRRRRPKRGPAQDARQAIDIVLDHLKRHGRSLWGHAIRLPKHAGGGIRLVERTNNALESFFRSIKHGERRRSGRKVLTHDFKRLPASAALVRNLEHEDYVEILCGSLDRLPDEFAKLDADERRRRDRGTAKAGEPDTANFEMASGSMPRPDRALIRTTALHARIVAAAQSRAPYAQINP